MSDRLDNLRLRVGITDVIPTLKDNGSCTCPACGGVGKFWVTKNSYFKCFKSDCILNQYYLGSDVIALYRWTKGYETKAEFWTAVQELEASVGINYSLIRNERHTLLAKCVSIYSYYLKQSQAAMNYLESRGFSKEIIEMEGIGFAPYSSCLRRFDLASEDLIREGLLSGDYEYFSNRIIFPIRSRDGSLVHFVGRYLGEVPKDNQGKDLFPRYKNSKSSNGVSGTGSYLVFEDKIKGYDSKQLILVEGYPDALTLYERGYAVVGLLGLEGLTKQVQKLSKFEKIICLFDNDKFEANHPYYPLQYKSWRKIIPQLIEMQNASPSTTFEVLMIPDEWGDVKCKDVNDLFSKANIDKGGFDSLLLRSVDLVEYLITNWGADIDKHQELIRLIASTGRGSSLMSRVIPSTLSPLEYAVRVFT